MKTAFILMAQYDGKAVIPIEDVCRDYFGGMTEKVFLRKVLCGEIKLPVARMEDSKRCAKGIHLNDLAAYLDRQAELARKEIEQLSA